MGQGEWVRVGRVYASAAKEGRLEVLQWARANGCAWDGGACCGAAQGGQLEVLQWAKANGCEWDQDRVLYWASTSGTREGAAIMEWIESLV